MRIAIITDAWHPQINGVVRTLCRLTDELRSMGHDVLIVGPHMFANIACPTYPEIRLALWPRVRLNRILRDFAPDAIHLTTEGPLGLSARRWCMKHGHAFTTSFHTRFAEYLHARSGFPTSLTYRFLRWFHAGASWTLVATPSLLHELQLLGFGNLRCWTRGVDLTQFSADGNWNWLQRCGAPGPYLLYVGRVAVEKNIDAFLSLDLPGTKIVVGNGPDKARLQKAYPETVFAGYLTGAELSCAYAASDVFVFPSLTDTFGLVLLEALACGLPVAAFDVTGPRDIIPAGNSRLGAIGPDLRANILKALDGDRTACRAHAAKFSWKSCAEMFLRTLTDASDILHGRDRKLRSSGALVSSS